MAEKAKLRIRLFSSAPALGHHQTYDSTFPIPNLCIEQIRHIDGVSIVEVSSAYEFSVFRGSDLFGWKGIATEATRIIQEAYRASGHKLKIQISRL